METNAKATRKRKIRISKISALHYIKLTFRSVLLIAAMIDYILMRAIDHVNPENMAISPLQILVWLVFVVEMIFRFIPSGFESMGCQKVFKANYRPSNASKTKASDARSTFLVVLSWTALNAFIGLMYKLKWIDAGILRLICLAYSVCDMICILFFCPFQEWFMKNKCCGTCRIYNWDYAMMFTPLIFVGGFWNWSLLVLSFGLLVKWEITYRLHPEWFSERTNLSLSCANCREKLCKHKKSLQRFLHKMGKHFWN